MNKRKRKKVLKNSSYTYTKINKEGFPLIIMGRIWPFIQYSNENKKKLIFKKLGP